MKASSLVPIVLVTVCALGLISFIAWSLFRPLVGDLLTWARRSKLGRKQRLLKNADELAKQGALEQALSRLQEAFMLDHTPLDPVLIESISHHHLSILSRLIALSDQRAARLPHLAVVEDLLASRAQLLRALHEAVAARKSLRERRGEKKDLPEWALAEYEKKVVDIRDRLATNRKSLESKLSEIFSALRSMTPGQEVTYH